MKKEQEITKKDNSFSQVILLTSVIFILLLILLGFTAWRNSEAEIGNLKVSEKVDQNNKPISPTNTISSKAESIYVSGRLAHTASIKVKVEFINTEGNYNQTSYPKIMNISVGTYPNNYFSIQLDENSCKPCTGSGWRVGKYKVKVYPESDQNPIKPEVSFEIIP
jgi:excinuclease UvrABC ATPase subunit